MKDYQTPMMRQYMSIKKQYPDCLLFFRLGDFYELFLEDAKIGSKILDITLTSRGKGKDGKIPMCGVPYHSIDTYLGKIIKAGYKAAICEQVGEARSGKDIVARDVMRIITPGTIVDESMLDNKTNNFILTIKIDKKKNSIAIAYADISTGQFLVRNVRVQSDATFAEGECKEQSDATFAKGECKEQSDATSAEGECKERSDATFAEGRCKERSDATSAEGRCKERSDAIYETAVNEIKNINPSEVVLEHGLYSDYDVLRMLRRSGQVNITTARTPSKDEKDSYDYIKEHFKVRSLDVFEIDEADLLSITAIAQLLDYLRYTQKDKLFHIKKIQKEKADKYMHIDTNTLGNLEIFYSNRTGRNNPEKHSLVDTIDKTLTSIGGRMLKTWLTQPLSDEMKIKSRHTAVGLFTNNHNLRGELINKLKLIADLERLLSKLGTKTSNARDLMAIKTSLSVSIDVINLLKTNPVALKIFMKNQKLIKSMIQDAKTVIEIIKTKIKEDPPVSIREGGMINDGINQELDDIKNSIKDSKDWISKLEEKEKRSTGISSLRVGFTSVFGYYIEVSKASLKFVPTNYIRKQTLVNSERYITDDLKYREEIVLNAEDQINKLEYEIFQNVVDEIIKYAEKIQYIASLIATVDCLNGFAVLALEKNYTKPNIYKSDHFNVELIEARHAVVENALEAGEFTPNSTNLNKEKYVHLITGPNMAGKSTYIRQVALIQLLAQIGSYVPAFSAKISVVDGIYTRIGAGDALAQGLSTFMVEMIETAKILNNATKNSLIILDEVGRGTSTIDGLSIARAVVEYIHDKIKAKTLFATHFHELTNLDQRLKKLENYHVGTSDIRKDRIQGKIETEIKFLHKVEKGGTDKSYGVEVAKLAGVPDEVIKRARELLIQNSTSQLKLDI